MLKSFFPCTAPMLATLFTTALSLTAQYREFEALDTKGINALFTVEYK